jgi:hypothetical protein
MYHPQVDARLSQSFTAQVCEEVLIAIPVDVAAPDQPFELLRFQLLPCDPRYAWPGTTSLSARPSRFCRLVPCRGDVPCRMVLKCQRREITKADRILARRDARASR